MAGVKRIAGLIVLLAALAVAQNPASETLALQNAGRIKGQTYTNDAIGFSVDLPAKWTVEDASQMERAAEAGHRELYGREPNAAEEHERAEKMLVQLVAATPGRNGFQDDPRSIQIMAIPRSRLSPEEQKDFTPVAILQNPVLINVPLKPKRLTIARTEFATAGTMMGPVNVAGNQVSVYLGMYCAIRGDNALVFGITGGDEKETDEVAKTLETLRFFPPKSTAK